MKSDASFAIVTAPKKDALHWKVGRVTWDEIKGWMESPATRKDTTGYVLGTLEPTTRTHRQGAEPCLEMHRNSEGLVTRSAITADIDSPEPGFPDIVELLFPYASILHTTFSSAPDAPRYRLIIPTDREMTPDEYVIATKSVMQRLGENQFDPGSSQPERFMYVPSAKEPSWFHHWVFDGNPAPVDDLLEDFEEDLSQKPLPKPNKNKRDPFEIDGVVGAFNRAYEDWDDLIEAFSLPYEKVAEDRYQLVGARSVAGMGPVKDVHGFVYSHHASDPAYGKACSAFDLVRLHRFSELDEGASGQTPVNKLPSHLAMLELATQDTRVIMQMVGTEFSGELEEIDERERWRADLRLAPRTGKLLPIVHNWDLLRENDPVFRSLYFNEMSLAPEVHEDLPWRAVTEGTRMFESTDRSEMVFYLERTYRAQVTVGLCDALIDTTASKRRVNPIREWLSNLAWDGTPRVEECLPGVLPTDYTRLVARKALVAAVARMMEPGCKWDHTLVLYGPEGIGKSWWIDRIARGYSSELGKLQDKDTKLAMQRSWIMIADEGHSLRKADQDEQKEFLTRTTDMLRLPYDREIKVYPRHCVIWSTTNDETFLRRQEGNRRFLIVHCQFKVDFEALTDEYVEQLWAEAVHLYHKGEPLFLADPDVEQAAQERERFIEEDALAGIIDEYLEQRVPNDWWDKSPEGRRAWMDAMADGFEREGTNRIDRTCSTQIWVEALGRKIGDHRRTDLLDITTALKRLNNWVPLPSRARLPGYGPQMIFARKGTERE